MLQNPSKYHPNPLSHFLALHNSQAAHNAHPHALPSAAAGHNQFHQHHPAIMANHHHSHHLRSPHAHLIDAANTSLDVGKSFTIAAILGLQKSAIENNRKEYNNVINLSLNGSSGNHHSQNLTHTTNDMNNGENRRMPNNNNHHNNNNSNKTNASSDFGSVNNFNCDSNAAVSSAALVNRYLPTASASSASSFVASASHQQQTLTIAPSALQSLQQLHQHHAQQTSLNFHREKLKSENNSKKSSLKNKRVRTIFTPEQLERLEAEFERQQYMVGPERLYLAHTLQLTEAQVKVWFQNRRIKWRKHHLEITQQRLALLRQSQLPSTSTAETIATGVIIASSPGRGQSEEINHSEEMPQSGGSRQPSESDLSICNDSMDAESVIDGGDDTEI